MIRLSVFWEADKPALAVGDIHAPEVAPRGGFVGMIAGDIALNRHGQAGEATFAALVSLLERSKAATWVVEHEGRKYLANYYVDTLTGQPGRGPINLTLAGTGEAATEIFDK